MNHISFVDLVEKLKLSKRVKGIFSTGTTATILTPSSDIDLIILLDKNTEEIKSLFTTIENRFSDIYFFDVEYISQLENKNEISGNSFDGIFIDWLKKGKIEYDPENILTNLKNKIEKYFITQKVTDLEKRDFWVKINYNFIANTRYFYSNNTIYHQALEIRLLYSIVELISAYFCFRSIPWRGEKTAIKYFELNDSDYYTIFQNITSKSSSLEEKMKYYTDLFNNTFFDEYKKWEEDFFIAITNKNEYNHNLNNYLEILIKE